MLTRNTKCFSTSFFVPTTPLDCNDTYVERALVEIESRTKQRGLGAILGGNP